MRESRSGVRGSIRSLAPQSNSGSTLGRHRAPPGDTTIKTGSEKANEAVEDKQDKEGDEKGRTRVTVGGVKREKIGQPSAGEGRAAERECPAPVGLSRSVRPVGPTVISTPLTHP